jgi:hypothetical protein
MPSGFFWALALVSCSSWTQGDAHGPAKPVTDAGDVAFINNALQGSALRLSIKIEIPLASDTKPVDAA